MLPREIITIREWFSYRLQTRHCEVQTILRSRTLFQQFVVDEYCMIELDKLRYISKHQKELRVDKYSSLTEGGIQSQG
jgi:hypothetical protein